MRATNSISCAMRTTSSSSDAAFGSAAGLSFAPDRTLSTAASTRCWPELGSHCSSVMGALNWIPQAPRDA